MKKEKSEKKTKKEVIKTKVGNNKLMNTVWKWWISPGPGWGGGGGGNSQIDKPLASLIKGEKREHKYRK